MDLILKHTLHNGRFSICKSSNQWNNLLMFHVDGAKGVQLAELGMQSWKERTWVDIPVLD